MDYRNIQQIRNYEIKKITRDWGFRLSVLVSMGVIGWLHLITQGNGDWVAWVSVSLPSAIPYVNAYLAVYFQLLFAVLWAGNWFFCGRSEQTEESVEVHAFSNAEWVWGRIAGFVVVQVRLSLLWMLDALCVNLFFSDAPFSLYPYVFYYITLFVPAMLFTVGCVVAVKGWVRNRVMALLVLVLLFYALAEFGDGGLYGILSLRAGTLPNMFSDVTGFAGTGVYLLQRLVLCLLGVGLMFWAVARERRMPNIPQDPRWYVLRGAVLVLVGGLCAGVFALMCVQEEGKRESVREVYARYAGYPMVFVKSHDIIFRQEGSRYMARSEMILVNESGRDAREMVLYLNPGLQVSSVLEGGEKLEFARDGQAVVLRRGLKQGDSVRVVLEYDGNIRPEVCYPEVKDRREVADYRTHYLFRQGEDYYYLRPDLTILTPECVWYPVSLPPVNPDVPVLTMEYYTDFSLRVVGERERTVLSQGQMSREGDTLRFNNAYRLPGLTLCMGPYTRMGYQDGDVLYELYLLKGHEFLVAERSLPEDLMRDWREIMWLGRIFPYHKQAVVEAPLHFCAYGRSWRNRSEFVQPEILFRPEREAVTFNPKWSDMDVKIQWTKEFRDVYTGNMFKDRFPGNYPKPESIESEYSPIAIRNMFQAWVFSPDFPGVNMFVDFMRDELWSNRVNANNDNVFTDRRAIELMREANLREVVTDPHFKEVVRLKSLQLLGRLLGVASVEELREFWTDFYSRHNFTSLRYETLCREVQERFGFDMLAVTRQLYDERGLPWFEFKDAWVEHAVEDGKDVYQYRVKVWNRGKVEGILRFCIISRRDTCCVMKAGECKEFRFRSEDSPDPERWELQTVLAMNIPAAMEWKMTPEEAADGLLPAGIFPVDTAEFLVPPGEYIVDDTERGFLLYTSAGDRMDVPEVVLDRQWPKRGSFPWRAYTATNAYGSPEHRYLSKTSGLGNLCAAWEAELPETGKYEVFVFNNAFESKDHEPRGAGTMKSPEGTKTLRMPGQTYTVVHADGRETVVVETRNADWGWVSIGTYAFEKGKARVELSDAGVYPAQMIYADAVKWVKR